MPIYQYKARTPSGELKKGTIEAANEEAAASLLAEYGLVITYLGPEKEAFDWEKLLRAFQRVSVKEKVVFTRQLATMINAGLPIIQALKSLINQTRNKTFQEIIERILREVEGGTRLSEAMAKFPEVFPKLYTSMVAAGEASGQLDKSLAQLADQLEKNYALMSKIRSALYYPAFILLSVGVGGAVLVTQVVPQIATIFAEANATLPLPTRLLMAVSDFLSSYWWLVLLVLLGGIFALWTYIKTPLGRQAWDEFKLALPKLKEVFQKIYMARFTRTLGTLLRGGLPILEAMEITSDAVGNVVIKQSILASRHEVENGVPLAKTLEKDENFLEMVPQMVAVGEQTGSVDEMLLRLADFYDAEVDNFVKAFSSLIEPALIILMGLLVATLVASILLPIYNLAQVITF